MLRWSAETTGRVLELSSVADPSRQSGIEAGPALSELARTASGITTPSSDAVDRVAEQLGPAAASDAAAVAAAFEGLNRIVDGTGLPIGRAARRDQADIISALNLDTFPHAAHGA